MVAGDLKGSEAEGEGPGMGLVGGRNSLCSARHHHGSLPCSRSCFARKSGERDCRAPRLLLLSCVHVPRQAPTTHSICLSVDLLSCAALGCCRQDRSFLLQAFRFFITNDFLVNHTPGQQLKFPESGQGDVDEAPAQAQPVTAEELLGKNHFSTIHETHSVEKLLNEI